jgi:hypothetical protein
MQGESLIDCRYWTRRGVPETYLPCPGALRSATAGLFLLCEGRSLSERACFRVPKHDRVFQREETNGARLFPVA